MKCEQIFVTILVTTTVIMSLCEARGGRRGGSFGGLFGGWRKYKKPSNGGGSSRRIVSSSPVHTPITKAWHENKKSSNSDKFHKYNKPVNNMATLPMGASYYQNNAALPQNSIYVGKAPPTGTDFGDFFTGYLTGQLLGMGFSAPRHHVTYVPNQENIANSNNPFQSTTSSTQPIVNLEKIFSAPLMDFIKTTTAVTATEAYNSNETESSTTQLPVSAYGFICVPILIDEKNAKGEIKQNERIVCYPAPASLVPQKDIKSKPVEIAGDIIEH